MPTRILNVPGGRMLCVTPGGTYITWAVMDTSTATSTTGSCYWHDFGTTATAATTTLRTWVQMDAVDFLDDPQWQPTIVPQRVASPAIIRESTEAEMQRLRDEQAEARRLVDGRNVQHRAAMARARELLLEHLTPQQRKTFEENGWFIVRGGQSKKQYRISTQGYAGNVSELHDSGHAAARYCAHAPANAIPLHDHFIAQKYMLEFAEDDFLRVANRTAVHA